MKFFNESIMIAVCFAILPQVIFTSLFLLTKKKKESHNIFGIMFLITLSFMLLREVSVFYFQNENLWIPMRIFAYPLLLGTFLYLYIKNLIYVNSKFNWKFLYHLMPFGIVSFIYILFYPNSESEAYKMIVFDPFIKPSWQGKFMGLLYFSSYIFYTFKILKLLKKYNSELKEFYSSIGIEITISWLYWIILSFYIAIIFLGSLVILIRLQALGLMELGVGKLDFHIVFWLFVSFNIFVSSFFMIRQSVPEISYMFNENISSNLLLKNEVEEIRELSISDNNIDSKYQKSGLSPELKKEILEKLIICMDTKKPFLNEDINLKSLANLLNVSVNHLSQTINETWNKNFYNFINEYRIEETLKRLKNPQMKDISILEIAFSSGFNSKSSFNNFFKKKTGLSPTEFRKGIHQIE